MANYGDDLKRLMDSGWVRPDEAIRGGIDGPALEAIRQMQEEKTQQRMRAIAALIARLQGHKSTGQEQMGQSPRDQRFWMNEGARRQPVPLRSGGQRPVPRQLLPSLSPEGFHHEILGQHESGPEPMYGKSRTMNPDYARTMARLVRGQLNPIMEEDTYYGNPVELYPMNTLMRRARGTAPGILGTPEVPRRGPPNMGLRRRYVGW